MITLSPTLNAILNRSFRISLVVLIFFSFSVRADELIEQTDPNLVQQDYISCSVITAEYLTVLQLAQRGLSEEQALKDIPFTHRKAKPRVKHIYALIRQEGILNAYSLVNSNFARCAKIAHEANGIPAKDMVEYGYYYCAGENKLRYELILRINESFDLNTVLKQTPDTHFDVAINYFELIERKGILSSFDYTANNLKACLKQIL